MAPVSQILLMQDGSAGPAVGETEPHDHPAELGSALGKGNDVPRLDQKKYDFDVLEHVFGGVRATSDEADMSPIVCSSSIAPETLESEILIRVRVSDADGSDRGEG